VETVCERSIPMQKPSFSAQYGRVKAVYMGVSTTRFVVSTRPSATLQPRIVLKKRPVLGIYKGSAYYTEAG
jgi:hypothetical protein